MVRIFQRNVMLTAIIFSILLISCAWAFSVPTVYALEPDTQAKTMAVLSSVVGLNTQSYQISKTLQFSNQYISLPQEETIVNLVSNGSSVKADCYFVNNKLRLLYLSEYKGTPYLKQQIANTVNMAKDFLGRYQSFSNDQLYGSFAAMLSSVKETGNFTQINGNMKLEVSNFDQKTINYIWTFVDSNGVEAAAKNVILSYYNGQLQDFLNNWPLYKVVTDTPKISVEKATEIAIEASKSYSYNVTTVNGTFSVSGFKVAAESLKGQTLSYLNSPDKNYARAGDPFTLYPSWFVQLGFDKFYPGDVTGMTITVWADTGKVGSMYHTVCTPKSQPTTNLPLSKLISGNIIPTSFLVMTAIFVIGFLVIKRRTMSNAVTNRKMLSLPLVALLSLTIITGVVFSNVPKVDASLPNSMIGRSTIYGITMGTGLPESEAQAGYDVTDYIETMTGNNGYSVANMYGSSTIKDDVLDCIQYSENNFGQVAAFYFGHFATAFYTAFQDNSGYPINYSDISSHTTTAHKHFFVWIWACVQAETSSSNMPKAWTQRDGISSPIMSNDGYNSPDTGLNCYMTFDGISPEIGNSTNTFNYATVQAFPTCNAGPLKNFIEDFYYYALSSGHQDTVHNALNLASLNFFSTNYENSVLNQGYPGAYYPVDHDYWAGNMLVFGDSAIKLYQPSVYFCASGDDNNQLYPSFTINGVQGFGTGSNYFMQDVLYQIGVPNNVNGYHFDHFYYNGGYYYSNPADICLCQDGTLTACYIQDYINILGSDEGYTDPIAGYYRGSGSMQITAYPYQGNPFSYWLLNDGYLSSNPTVYVDYGANTLRPVYNPYAWLTVYTCDQASNEVPANIYVDNTWIGCGYASVYLPLGAHSLYVDDWVWDDYWQQYVFPVSSNWSGVLTSDTYVTVYYAY